ncbi:MAG: Rieske 2Fe-2S domain-containing protein [Marinosulfonomonas sp.]|nr:Rieske 2Fe-2S domain-containing protein [Marinosulfonomonas sp.]
MSSSDELPIGQLVRKESVHSRVYTDKKIFDREMEEIFRQGWVFIGHASEVPKKGNFIRRTMGLEEVLMVRTMDNEISVLANRCTHRGNLLCQHKKGKKRNFACEYHGWVFDFKGNLIDVPFSDGFKGELADHATTAAKVSNYRGFVFATFNTDPISLEEHLGRARFALDRASDLAPGGELDLYGGWVEHAFKSNWKMLAENNVDGYHVSFVHDSFAKGIKVNYKYENVLVTEEDKLECVARDLGDGHAEIDYEPTYEKPLVWLGVDPDRYPEYTDAMAKAYGAEESQEIMRKGPPHTFIFPNLFIAETAVTMVQPTGVDGVVNWHTPLYLKGAPEAVNRRILRQCEAALGPSAFLLADDATISERQWAELENSPAWLDLSRGADREEVEEGGTITSHYTDETPNRGYWQHYAKVFNDADARAADNAKSAVEAAE